MTLYETLAKQLRTHIEQGFFANGSKLPSVRQLSHEHGVSLSTVQEAYRQLEFEGVVEARPKSGYFVTQPSVRTPLPTTSRPPQRPLDVSQWEELLNMILSNNQNCCTQLQHAMPNMAAASLQPLLKKLADLTRQQSHMGLAYADIRGLKALREQLCRLAVASGCQLHPDDLVITSGCQEAISVCLRAVTQPGDIVAVESPSFYGSIQAIKGANLKAMEIPTDPETGLSLEALELALDQWPIKAILLTPTCNNPMGYTMPEANKQRLYKLAQSYDICIIDYDIYGDISYTFPRPRTVKSFDEDGRVLLCSSFSKTLAPGFRVGWIAPGRYRDNVTHVKYVSSSMCPTLPQLAVADFIKTGGYERHVRRMRQQYQQSRDHLLRALRQYFPQNTRISYPQGGFVLWVELDKRVDIVELSQRCRDQSIHIAPGILFSSTGKYRNSMRLNFSEKTALDREKAIETLASILQEMMNEVHKAIG